MISICSLINLSAVWKIVSQTWRIDSWWIVGFPNNLVQGELQLDVWQTQIYSIWLCSHRDSSNHPRDSDHKSFLWSRRLSVWGAQFGDVWKWCGQIRLSVSESSESLEFPDLLDILCIQMLQGPPVHNFSRWFRYLWSLSVATSSSVLKSNRASVCHPWGLNAASGWEFRVDFTPKFPEDPICRLEALSIPGLFDAIGLFTDEELVETETARFIDVGLDFATILLSSFCSCILFATVSVQLVKLKFLAQQRELKWLMLNKRRRLFHSSRVKFPYVNISAIWCLVSMYLIRILGSKLILSNNPSRPTLWVLGTWLIVGLLPLIILLITASLSSNTYLQSSSRLRNFYIRRQIVNVIQIRTVVLGWNFGLVSGLLARCGLKQQVQLYR